MAAGRHPSGSSPGVVVTLIQSLAQVLANDGSGQAALTERLKQEVLASVTAYGGAQALRCLALARKSMPAGSSRVRGVCGPQCAGHWGVRRGPCTQVRGCKWVCRGCACAMTSAWWWQSWIGRRCGSSWAVSAAEKRSTWHTPRHVATCLDWCKGSIGLAGLRLDRTYSRHSHTGCVRTCATCSCCSHTNASHRTPTSAPVQASGALQVHDCKRSAAAPCHSVMAAKWREWPCCSLLAFMRS